jgi:antitoxin Phd
MKRWQVQDAKARFSEMLDLCLKEGPQIITKRGEEAAILVPMVEWKRENDKPAPNLREFLLDHSRGPELPLPSPKRLKRKAPVALT